MLKDIHCNIYSLDLRWILHKNTTQDKTKMGDKCCGVTQNQHSNTKVNDINTKIPQTTYKPNSCRPKKNTANFFKTFY